MHNVSQTMAVESMLSIGKQSWCIWLKDLKTMDAVDYKQTANCLFAILGWLGQPTFDNLITSGATPSWLISYLKSVSFSKYVPLSYSVRVFTKYSRFPYQVDTINEWFTYSTEDIPRDQAVNIINVDKDGQTRKCYKTQNQADVCFPESLEDDEFEIFFHGTKHRSAKDIIEGGIKVRRRPTGNDKQDFSQGDGFYVGNNFDEAWRWSHKSWPNSAVLVFRVKKIELRGDDNEKGLDLGGLENKKEWQKVVSQFRSEHPDPKFRRELNKNYQFIEGPMASISSKNPRLAFPVQKDGTYQLCVRNENCAELFNRSLHSAVFFDREVK